MMVDKLRALSEEYDMLPAGALVLCAVSGGADSMCLLHLLCRLAPELGFSVRCAHFNHNLRGEESLRDEGFVRDRCREWNIPFICGGADVGSEASRTGRGVEETARSLRYEFLERAAAECSASRIATAHTANDNAETMLFHLVRGSGLQGLTGIPPRRGDVVRPLLTVTRAEVEEYCTQHGVPYVEDSTNNDETYTRNYLRHRVVPLLEQMNPRAVENFSLAAGRLRTDNDYLNFQAADAAALARETSDGLVVAVDVLTGLPDAIAVRTARQLLERTNAKSNCSSAHIKALLALCRSVSPSGRVDLPGVAARRAYGELILAPAGAPEELPGPVSIREREWTTYGATGWSVYCRRVVCPETSFKNPDSFFLSCDKITGALRLRSRQTGDVIKLPGRATKSIKKLLIEEKVPLIQRDYLPVLVDDGGVLALASFGPEISRLAQPGEEAFEILVQKV